VNLQVAKQPTRRDLRPPTRILQCDQRRQRERLDIEPLSPLYFGLKPFAKVRRIDIRFAGYAASIARAAADEALRPVTAEE
jgi:hypothetical protein